MSVDAYSWTWEQILRAVVMAGRPDRLYELQRQWYKAMQRLDVVSKALRRIRSQVDDHKWSGPGADAYRKHYDKMIKSIDKVYSDASSMIDIAEQLAVNLAAAITEIPCPDVRDVQNLGVQHIGVTEANDHGGSSQYSSYQQSPALYHGSGIYEYVKAQFHQTQAGKRAWNHYYEKATQSWYKRNTEQAQNSFASLIATYRDCNYSMPDLSGDGVHLDPTFTPDHSSDPQTGSDTTSGSTAYRYGTSPGSGYTPTSHGLSHAPPRHYSTPGSSLQRRASSSAGGNPDHVADSGTGLAGSSPRDVLSPDTYGANERSGYGSSPANVDYRSTFEHGSSSGAAPGSAASYGQPGLPAATAETPAARNSSTYGAVPSSGTGRGSRDRETRQTWLTEDEDFFAPDTSAPPPIIDQAYMEELDERDRRRREWW